MQSAAGRATSATDDNVCLQRSHASGGGDRNVDQVTFCWTSQYSGKLGPSKTSRLVSSLSVALMTNIVERREVWSGVEAVSRVGEGGSDGQQVGSVSGVLAAKSNTLL